MAGTYLSFTPNPTLSGTYPKQLRYLHVAIQVIALMGVAYVFMCLLTFPQSTNAVPEGHITRSTEGRH